MIVLYGLLEKNILELLILFLQLLHIKSHRLDSFLIVCDFLLQDVCLELLLVELTLRSKELFLSILVLFLEKGDELVLLLLLRFSSLGFSL